MEKFDDYLKDIGLTSIPFTEKIEFVYNICSQMCPEEIKDIIITNYIKNDANEEFVNLWFFSDKYCLEAKQFLTKYDLDITYIYESIKYWNIKLEDYSYNDISNKSILYLEAESVMGIAFTFRAQGKNCGYLKAIIDKYFKPNTIF